MTSVYVLELEQGKFYVGKCRTANLNKRIDEHRAGNGSAWTAKYPYKRHYVHHNDAGPFDEDAVTKEYMFVNGIDNVRGGAYCQIELSDAQRNHLTAELRSARNECYRCGRLGHYANDCDSFSSSDSE